jgi:hypothetical protein
MTNDRYCICLFNDDSAKVLARYSTYGDADDNLDNWCEMYPYAYVDIVSMSDI